MTGSTRSPLRQLGREFRECARRGSSVTDAWRLSRDTLAFHVANRLRRPIDYGRCHSYGLRIAGRMVDVHLRRHAGDLFVFHEVFTSRAYQLPGGHGEIRTVLDLGSHIGLTTLFWLEALPAARVVCVEAAPDNARLLRQNVASFSDRVDVIEGAVSDRSGTVRFSEDGASWGRGVARGSGEGRAVRAVTVEDVIHASGLTRIDLLKVDIEGAEAEVFDRVRPWMAMVRMIIIEIHPPYTIERFAATIEAAGFRLLVPSAATDHQMLMAVRAGDSEKWPTGAAAAAAVAG